MGIGEGDATEDAGMPSDPTPPEEHGQGIRGSHGADLAHVTLASTSRSADAGHMSAADISTIAEEAGLEFRLVGGNAVSLLVWVHGVSELVPDRETNDADLGIPGRAIGAASLIEAMLRSDYEQVEGNRFAKTVEHNGAPLTMEIDVLIPSLSDHMESNQPFGELVVDAIPGLAVAIARPPTLVEVTARLTTGIELVYVVPLPDPVSALVMKAYAFRDRTVARDALDVWRLLEVAHKLGMGPLEWPKGASGRASAETLQSHFGQPGARGPALATADKSSQTRIRALVNAIVPTKVN